MSLSGIDGSLLPSDDLVISPAAGPGQLDIDVSTIPGTGLGLGVSNATISGLDVSRAGETPTGTGIRLVGSDNIIENITATNRERGLYLYPASDVTVSDCFIRDNEVGVYVRGSSNGIVINDSVISGNNTYGVQNVTTTDVNAENNYWGSPDGPSGAWPGSGDAITTLVDADPFLGSPPPAEFVVRVVDQYGDEIVDSAIDVPGVGRVETGSAVSSEAGDLSFVVMPTLPSEDPMASGGLNLRRTEVRSVDVTTSVVEFEWIVQDVPITLVDQNGNPIVGANGQSSAFQVGAGQRYENGMTVALPITDNAVYPTIGGFYADGYDIVLLPAILDYDPVPHHLTELGRTEVAEVSSDTSSLTFEWQVQQVEINLVDQFGVPIVGADGQSSALGFFTHSSQRYANGMEFSLPITDAPDYPPLWGYYADGYDIYLLPAFLDFDPGVQHFHLGRTEVDEVSSDTSTLTYEWQVIEGPLAVVDGNEDEIPGSEFRVTVSTAAGTGSDVALPITDHPNYPVLFGYYADGYDIYIRPDSAPSFSGPFAFELAGDGFFTPAFVDIDGQDVGLRFISNQAPTIDEQVFNIDENIVTVGTVVATDLDLPDDTLIYAITGGDDQGSFTIDPITGALAFLSAPDYELPTDAGSDNSYLVEVTVTDNGNESAMASMTVNVLPVNDNAPAFTSPDTANVQENSTAVHTVSATDADVPAQTVTFSITGNGADYGFFQITGGDQLEFIVAPDHETPEDFDGDNVYEVEIAANDNHGLISTQTVSVTVVNLASITGTVFVDVNENDLYDANEPGIDGVLIELRDETGAAVLDDLGDPITATTTGGGFYLFEDLDLGIYQLFENQPTGVDDGPELLGSLGGTIPANDTMQLTLERTDATDYVFAELGQELTSGDTATIGFWQNKHGQALITDGGTALADWLTQEFDNVFGDELVGANGAEVADFYKAQLFKQKGKKSAGPAKVDAQFMAVALATYFTSSDLAGTVAADYGFNVTQTGIGTKVVNVGSAGDAFGVDNGTDMTIIQLLLATNDKTDLPDGISGFAHIYDENGDRVIDSLEAALRAMANEVYSSINEDGDV